MSKSQSHKRAQAKAAGRGGQTEVRLSGSRRLDALTKGGNRATEVERSGTLKGNVMAARRLRDSNAIQKVLQVPNQHFEVAKTAMRREGVKGTVKNMGSTKRHSV